MCQVTDFLFLRPQLLIHLVCFFVLLQHMAAVRKSQYEDCPKDGETGGEVSSLLPPSSLLPTRAPPICYDSYPFRPRPSVDVSRDKAAVTTPSHASCPRGSRGDCARAVGSRRVTFAE